MLNFIEITNPFWVIFPFAILLSIFAFAVECHSNNMGPIEMLKKIFKK